MSRALFPLLPQSPKAQAASLPLLRDIAMDFEQGLVRFSGGEPCLVEGAEAVKAWAYRMLHTRRYHYAHLSFALGSEWETLIGRPYREESKQAEARRMIAEALLQSPYITAVEVQAASLIGSTLCLHATIQSVYGEVSIHV